MPRGHGRTVFIPDNVADRRSSTLYRRLSEQSSHKLSSMENLVVVPVLTNCEESRSIVLRFLKLDVHLARMLAPCTSCLQGPELRNEQGSQNPANVDMLNGHYSSYPQPTVFFQFDLQNKQIPSCPKNPAFTADSTHTVTDYKSMKNKDSSWHNYSSDCIDLNATADVTGKVYKPAKQSSRKKGKKKRKQYKRSMNKRASVKLENQVEEINCDASKSESSPCGDLVCSSAPENNLSLVVACPSLLVQDTSSEASEQRECNDKDSSSVGKKPLVENINGSRKQLSLPSEFTDDDADNMSYEVVTSGSNQSSELSLSTSLRNNPEIDMTEDSLDDCGTEWSTVDEGGFNPLENRMNLTSRNVLALGECKDSHQDNDLSSSCFVNCSDWQKDVADTDCSSERLLGSSQASSSDDFHPVIRTKRGRLARKFLRCSNEVHELNNAHLHRPSETNNKHSIWKKVEKASTSELTLPGNNKKIVSRNADVSLNGMETRVRHLSELKQSRRGNSFRCYNEMDSPKSYSSIVSSIVETNSGHVSMDSSANLEKLRRKPNLVSEQECQSARHTSVNNINIPSKIQVLRSESFDTAVEFTNNSQLADRIDTSLRSTKDSQNTILQKAPKPDNICSILQTTSSMCPEILVNSSVIESISDQSHADTQFHCTKLTSVDVSNDTCICTIKEDIQCNRLDMKSAHQESSRTDNSSGPLIQKCVSTGRLDFVISRSQMDDQVCSTVHNPIPTSLNLNFTDEVSSNPHSLVCLSRSETQFSSSSSSHTNCSSSEEGKHFNKLDDQSCMSFEESSDFPSPAGCHLSLETKESFFPGFETDLTKIIEAVDGVPLANGSLHAGFERVLHSASPLIETGCISMCTTCSQSQIIGDSLCFHQVPNMSLRKLWQWYEKPGSYGLEVKLDDIYNSKRSRIGLSKLCAYFVPYLSAVQLFGRSEKSIDHPKNDAEVDLMKTCDACDKYKCSTNLASLPIFSKLLPQPCKKEDTRLTKLSSSGKSEELNKPIFREQLADELLFEYFDSDQPQHRRPLFYKIQELILGDSSSNCHFFGDPSKLECLNLKELHPASWYAVAWYPIYQIPNGSFRAAFLTYHSFNRFVRRSTSVSTDGCINSLILPVVGLQSYNAQGEFWFEPTNLSSSENLKGRLQSLERTAYVMSRATVGKGGLNCANRHPDYEFFLSRKR